MRDAHVIPGAGAWSADGTGTAGELGVVVLHGFTGNPITTRPLGERLAAEGRTVRVPRLPGHGTTPRDMAGTRYADWLAAAEHAVDEVLERCRAVVVAGLSMGGTIALDIAARRDVAGVVTINAAVVLPPNPLLPIMGVLQHLVPFVPPKLAGLAEDDVKKPGVSEQAYDRVPMKAGYSLTRAIPRVRASLPQVHAPALVVNSAEDHSVDPGDADVIAAELGSTDVRRLVLADSYHIATLDNDQALLEDAVVDFLADVAPA